MNDIRGGGRTTLEAALAQMRLKLLDLTGRNRLLNFKPTIGKSLQFVEGQLAPVYNRLVEGTGKALVSIVGLPEPSRSDWVERNGRLARPDPREWASQKKISTTYELSEPVNGQEQTSLRALMYPDDLAKHCRKLEREANLAIEETGANMLFLVLGFLEFPDQRDSGNTFTAPLISVPVSMSKFAAGGNQNFQLQYTGEDISENLSLREKLKTDHSLILPELDDEEIDVEGYIDEVKSATRKRPGFAFRRRITLCMLSFANMLLVRDVDPAKWPKRGEKHTLLDHEIVRQVFEGGIQSSGALGGIQMASEHPVEEGPAARIPLIYDADSSQHSALVDVLLDKRNLVIEGPPGTGKSQTITNLIGASLADGKKVLFVAEKLAALQVVKNRLQLAGLDPFVLELHSNKTNKKQVLENIAARLNYKPSGQNDIPQMVQKLEAHRRDLRAYSALINSVSHNAFGLTLHQIMWKAEWYRLKLSAGERLLAKVAIADATEISNFELERRRDCLRHLGSQYAATGGFDSDSTFWGFYPDHIVPGDEVTLESLFTSSRLWSERFVSDVKHLNELLNARVDGWSHDTAAAELETLQEFGAPLDESLPLELIPKLFSSDAAVKQSKRCLEKLKRQIDEYDYARSAAQEGLLDENVASQSALSSLQRLEQIAAKLGTKIGTPAQTKELLEFLRTEGDRLHTHLRRISEFCAKRSIPFDGTSRDMGRFADLAARMGEVPDEHLHLLLRNLKDGCVPALEDLARLRQEWAAAEEKLLPRFYLDALPPVSELRGAIMILRQGDAWYRVFQGAWRSAVRIHKLLQRRKQREPSTVRISDLESLLALVQMREQWRSHSAWTQYLAPTTPSETLSLDGHLAVARWVRSTNAVLEELGCRPLNLDEITPQHARALRREFAEFKEDIHAVQSALGLFVERLSKLSDGTGRIPLEKIVELSQILAAEIDRNLQWFANSAPSSTPLSPCVSGIEAALHRRKIAEEVDRNAEAKELLSQRFNGVVTDIPGLLSVFDVGNEIQRLDVGSATRTKLISSSNLGDTCKSLVMAVEKVLAGLTQADGLSERLQAYGEVDFDLWVGRNQGNDLLEYAMALQSQLVAAARDIALLIPWSIYVARRKEAYELGLEDFIDFVEKKQLSPSDLENAYAHCTYATVIRESFRAVPELSRFSGLKQNQVRDEFKRLDREVIRLRGRAIAAQSQRTAVLPEGKNGTRVDEKSEMVLLHYLLPQQRPRMAVRKMLAKAGRAIQVLKPCFMMGPQAVAQYLTPGNLKFDLVIMDEASQLKPEEAVGSIARGGQLVVVGDANQLPPTSFFSRMNLSAEEDEQFTTTDAESILDVCSSHFQPLRSLRWHYRSQHHSLIAFSNHNFYRNNLIVFPSPFGQSDRLGVRATYLANAVYENQTNLSEANRVVAAVIEHVATRPGDSLGVVTLNIKQRDLISELLDEKGRTAPGLDDFKDRWHKEGQPLFVKNLETVQGDERDAIIISTTFGRGAESTAVRQNFGPISRQGGWRRLNVLFTRARKSVAIFTSLRPEDIVVDGATPRGTKALRDYLEYARSGAISAPDVTDREPDSDFESAVIEVLRARGYDVTPQLGVAGYRIDIGVKHPEATGTYLAAVECDGAGYHSAQSVRDRDRIRQEVLESLGWRGRIWRIWSTDWFRTPRQETEKLASFLDDVRKNWKPEHRSKPSWVEEGIASPSASTAKRETERQVVSKALVETEDDLEVEVGCLVRYADITKPDHVLTVRITQKETDTPNGLLAVTAPLAQILLGAVAGDEVSLNIPSMPPRRLKVLEVRRVT